MTLNVDVEGLIFYFNRDTVALYVQECSHRWTKRVVKIYIYIYILIFVADEARRFNPASILFTEYFMH